MDAKRQHYLWDERQVRRAQDERYMANRRRVQRIAATVDRLSGSRRRDSVRVLNIGIGDASLEGMLLDRGYDVHALDPSQRIVDLVRERYGLDETKARRGWSQELSFADDTFDCVIMSEVIEHLGEEEMYETFEQVRRVLKPGGHFIGTVPDNEDIDQNRYTCSQCGAVSHRVGHEQSFTVPTMRNALARYFQVQRVRSFRGMYMNWRGIIYYHWIDLPFKLARVWRPRVRAPHQIVFNIFFVARKA